MEETRGSYSCLGSQAQFVYWQILRGNSQNLIVESVVTAIVQIFGVDLSSDESSLDKAESTQARPLSGIQPSITLTKKLVCCRNWGKGKDEHWRTYLLSIHRLLQIRNRLLTARSTDGTRVSRRHFAIFKGYVSIPKLFFINMELTQN